MRMLLLVGWLQVPVIMAAWHYGPGQERLQLDDAADVLADAERHAAHEEWADAVAKYDEAIRLLPPGKVEESRRLRLERSKAQMLAKKLPTAHEELKSLVEELQNDPAADKKLFEQARQALANARYYVTWLMRLEGASKEDWEPEIEASRQAYRLLAEEAAADGDTEAANKFQQDLESSIRLARMDLSDLQGLPLPSQ
jgi:hypothetical protein